jgi:hypothetical protein
LISDTISYVYYIVRQTAPAAAAAAAVAAAAALSPTGETQPRESRQRAPAGKEADHGLSLSATWGVKLLETARV